MILLCSPLCERRQLDYFKAIFLLSQLTTQTFEWQEHRLIIGLPCPAVKPCSLPLKANQENLQVPNEYCLALPLPRDLLDSSMLCWQSFLLALITNSSLEMMSFFITSLWKRLGLGPEEREGVLHSGPDGSFTGLQLLIGGFRLPLHQCRGLHCSILSWCVINDSYHSRPLCTDPSNYTVAIQYLT